MAFRRKMSRGKSRKNFTKYASRTNSRNLAGSTVMRGGIRL